MIKIWLYLGTANFSIALLSLVRNVLIARMISVENFGIASTFAIVMALIEMTSNIAVDRLIVQARDGETPLLQATLQAIQAARGALAALILFIVADPLASLFEIPEVAWAYQAMAVIPLLRGLAHLDMFRFQRDMRFQPSVTVEFIAQFLSTAAAIPLALKLGDYRAMLWALLLQQAAFTIASHAVASRPYRWALDRQIIRRAVAFGWPLLLNGFLMFGTFQGDRIVVGSLIGMIELGWFSAAFMLTLMPTLVLGKTLQSYFLPQLARVQDDKAEFECLYLVTVQATLFAGIITATLVALVGPLFLISLYGEKYHAALSMLVWLAIMQALRLAKAGPAIVALSVGQTSNPLVANVVRVFMLPIAWILVMEGAGISAVLAAGIVGETLAFGVSLLLLHRKLHLALSGLFLPCVGGFATLALIAVDVWKWPPEASPYSNLHLFQFVLVASMPVLFWSMSHLRHWFGSLSQSQNPSGHNRT